MKIKIKIVACQHETKYGVSNYTRVVKKNEDVNDIITDIMKECDYDENAENEYFNSDVEEIIIDSDDFEIVR